MINARLIVFGYPDMHPDDADGASAHQYQSPALPPVMRYYYRRGQSLLEPVVSAKVVAEIVPWRYRRRSHSRWPILIGAERL
jgi:hypothetical protein